MTAAPKPDTCEPTPGPWTNKEHSTFVWSVHGNVCACGDPHASGHVGYTECEIGSQWLNEAVANAHLIAAAPDMLAALKDLLDDKGTTYAVRVLKARAAIAKAEGRS